MGRLYTGLLWLMKPSSKQETELGFATEYAEGKYNLPVRLIACPVGENYPAAFRGIPIRPDKRILAHHVYLVMAESNSQEKQSD